MPWLVLSGSQLEFWTEWCKVVDDYPDKSPKVATVCKWAIDQKRFVGSKVEALRQRVYRTMGRLKMDATKISVPERLAPYAENILGAQVRDREDSPNPMRRADVKEHAKRLERLFAPGIDPNK